MFDFLKRWKAPPPAPQRKPIPTRTKARKPATDPRLAAPGPLPEVVEGNEETDWALWEDSVSAMDSQRLGLPSQNSGLDKLSSSQFDDVDAFASVRKRDR
jgi:hypothetical protein